MRGSYTDITTKKGFDLKKLAETDYVETSYPSSSSALRVKGSKQNPATVGKEGTVGVGERPVTDKEGSTADEGRPARAIIKIRSDLFKETNNSDSDTTKVTKSDKSDDSSLRKEIHYICKMKGRRKNEVKFKSNVVTRSSKSKSSNASKKVLLSKCKSFASQPEVKQGNISLIALGTSNVIKKTAVPITNNKSTNGFKRPVNKTMNLPKRKIVISSKANLANSKSFIIIGQKTITDSSPSSETCKNMILKHARSVIDSSLHKCINEKISMSLKTEENKNDLSKIQNIVEQPKVYQRSIDSNHAGKSQNDVQQRICQATTIESSKTKSIICDTGKASKQFQVTLIPVTNNSSKPLACKNIILNHAIAADTSISECDKINGNPDLLKNKQNKGDLIKTQNVVEQPKVYQRSIDSNHAGKSQIDVQQRIFSAKTIESSKTKSNACDTGTTSKQFQVTLIPVTNNSSKSLACKNIILNHAIAADTSISKCDKINKNLDLLKKYQNKKDLKKQKYNVEQPKHINDNDHAGSYEDLTKENSKSEGSPEKSCKQFSPVTNQGHKREMLRKYPSPADKGFVSVSSTIGKFVPKKAKIGKANQVENLPFVKINLSEDSNQKKMLVTSLKRSVSNTSAMNITKTASQDVINVPKVFDL